MLLVGGEHQLGTFFEILFGGCFVREPNLQVEGVVEGIPLLPTGVKR